MSGWSARQLAMLREMGIEFGARAEMRIVAPASPAPPPPASRVAPSAAPIDVPSNADWLVVSEPVEPGSPVARLLANMLRAVGLMEGGDGPPGRRATVAMFEPGADLAFDRARLMDAVQRAAPRAVLAFGRAPARALLTTEQPLAELRGRVHRLGATPVVVTHALAYLLRQPAEKARAWDDLCLLVAAEAAVTSSSSAASSPDTSPRAPARR